MRKDLLRRLEILEMSPRRYRIDGLVWCAHIGKGRRSRLAENERIVEDWNIGDPGYLSSIRERVTTDPCDVGFNQWRDGPVLRADDPRLQRETNLGGKSAIVCPQQCRTSRPGHRA